jgi:hypothetical protein
VLGVSDRIAVWLRLLRICRWRLCWSVLRKTRLLCLTLLPPGQKLFRRTDQVLDVLDLSCERHGKKSEIVWETTQVYVESKKWLGRTCFP